MYFTKNNWDKSKELTWNDLDNHLNLYPRINDLQILDYDGKNTRWCLDKVRSGKLKLPMLNKSKLFELWKIRNKIYRKYNSLTVSMYLTAVVFCKNVFKKSSDPASVTAEPVELFP